MLEKEFLPSGKSKLYNACVQSMMLHYYACVQSMMLHCNEILRHEPWMQGLKKQVYSTGCVILDKAQKTLEKNRA